MTVVVEPSASISINGGPALPIAGGTIDEDRSRAPFIQATLDLDEYHGTIPDPRVTAKRDLRCIVTLTDSTGSETFGVSLRSVNRNRRTGQVSLRVATDEAIMSRYVRTTPAALPVSDLRTTAGDTLRLVLYPIIPATNPIEPGPATADITPRYGLTNMMMNPSVVGSLGTFFAAGTGTSAIDYSTAVGGMVGPSCLRWTASGTGIAAVSIRTYSARPGQRIEASCFVRSPGSRNFQIRFNWRDADGDLIKSIVSPAWPSSNAWVAANRPIMGGVAPPNTAKVGIAIERISGTAGEFSYADGFMVYEAVEPSSGVLEEYFDGSTSSTGYTTAWEDGAHTSQSVRIPIVERPVAGAYWQVGTDAWDYLSSLCSANALRLFQDRDEKWWLVDDTWSIPGTVTVTEGNTTDASETIDIDSPDGGITGVAVQYTWSDADVKGGAIQERWDSAGTTKRVRLVRYERAYPGPGAAAHILTSRQLDGDRLLPITTDMQITARAGMDLDVAWDTSGDAFTIAAVSFDLRAWQMTIRPRLV